MKLKCFHCSGELIETDFTYNHMLVYNCKKCDIDYVYSNRELYELEEIEGSLSELPENYAIFNKSRQLGTTNGRWYSMGFRIGELNDI